MGTRTGYPRRVARAKWTPPDDQTAAEVEEVVKLHRAWQEAEAAYKKAVTALLEKDTVPVAFVADRIGAERKTIYRHAGRSMT